MKNKLKLQPVEKVKTAKEVVYEKIKNAIFTGDIGHKDLMTEVMLAETLNISRTPVREAVGDLVSEGLLVVIPRKGLQVRDITESEKNQIIYLRLAIELEGLRRLAPKVTEKQIEDLRGLIKKQEEALENNDRIQFIEMDQQFHRKIVSFAKQELLGDILLNIYNLSRLVGHKALSKVGRMEEVIEEHYKVIDALATNDFEVAKESMREHLLKTSTSVVNSELDYF